ncbi:MAG: hypothetical protein ABSB60_15185 [Terracidiphilus sp.]|jgi:hypothetical protein
MNGIPSPCALDSRRATFAAKGTPVDATIASVSKPGPYGTSGILGLQAHSLSVRGITIPLHGTEVVWSSTSKRERAIGSIPFVDLASSHVYGNEAMIRPDMA